MTGPPVASAGTRSAAIGFGESPARQDVSRWILSLAGNILVALLYGVFLYSSIRFWTRTGSLVGLGIVVFNTMAVACLLTRRRPAAVTRSIRNWILAPLTTYTPFLPRPVGSASWVAILFSSVGQVIGLAIMIAGLIALNRSIGIVAANRGIRTRGVYAWVRHPLYAGEIMFFVSFLISNWSSPNAVIALVLILAQVVRSYQEEDLLMQDERYAVYRSAVPYRLIPRVY